MSRSELIEKMTADFPFLDAKSVRAAVDTFFEEITDQLVKGGRVEVRGFGSFSVRVRSNQKVRNPRTGESLTQAEKPGPFFKASKDLAARIRNHDQSL